MLPAGPRSFVVCILLLGACGPVASSSPDGSVDFSDGGPAVDAGADAGVDAGRSDAGLLDAGLHDAGVDAGTDAGVDAGLDAGPVLTGQLVGGAGPLPGAIAGVHYTSGDLSGDTDDAGTFHYRAQAEVSFSAGDVAFRPTAGRALLSAWQLSGAGTCTQSGELEKALVLLQSLDVDGDPTNGLALPRLAPPTTLRPLSGLSLADVQAVVTQQFPGRTAVSAATAVDRFIRLVDDEAWAELGLDTFSGLTALTRSQGAATDGVSWFFSGTGTIEKTDLAYNKLSSATIPLALYLTKKSDHIGDIDVYAGQVYAPLEDGQNGYQNPLVLQFDTQTLSTGTEWDISNTVQTAGVPWVAVDAARGFFYLAEWDPTSELHRYALGTGAQQSSLALTMPAGQTLGRIQGAKVYEGALYLACDDAAKTVHKLNLETGTVLPLFHVNTTGEQEGLAFLPVASGAAMHTLNVSASKSGSEFRHHQRTRPPLRQAVCP
jgi:hypothetical protein